MPPTKKTAPKSKSNPKPVASPYRTRPTATQTPCPHCGTPTLTGWDDDLMATQATIDTQPLTPAGETRAWETGTRTYELHSGRITWRGPEHITTWPAHKVNVYPAHRCGQHLDRKPAPPAEPDTWPGNPDQPPY